MIIIRFRGGLGNQFFQYACGYVLSKKNHDTLKFDITGYETSYNNDTLRSFDLEHYNITGTIASKEEIRRLKYPYGQISKGWRFTNERILGNHNIRFDQSILEKKGDVYLDGYWQSEKYFAGDQKDIREMFTLREHMGDSASEIKKLMESSTSTVSVHVRRGDNVCNPASIKHWGTLGIDYYNKALSVLSDGLNNQDRTAKLRIFVFSDDILWCKKNLKFDFETTFVSRPDINSWEEIILMSMCDHNVIANSTFSWWGAWLNNNPDKIVVAPKVWELINPEEYADIIPPSWIRIDEK